MQSSTNPPLSVTDPKYPFDLHTFESINRYWFDVPRDPPLVMLRDAISRNSASFLEGQINQHQDFLSISIVQHGRARHLVNDQPYEVARGDVFVMGLGARHQYLQCEELEIDALYFPPSLIDPSIAELLVKQPALKPLLRPDATGKIGAAGGGERWKHLTPASLDDINVDLAELKREWSTATDVSRLLTRLLFVRFILHLSRTTSAFETTDRPIRGGTPLSTPEVVAAALQIIENQFTEPLRLEDVASTVCVSADWLTRLFVSTTGRTPRDYLRYLRIERAKALLLSSMDTITEIAGKSGFGDSAYFARAFRQETGMSPREYREKFASRSAGKDNAPTSDAGGF